MTSDLIEKINIKEIQSNRKALVIFFSVLLIAEIGHLVLDYYHFFQPVLAVCR